MAKVSFSTKLKMTIFYEAENDNLLKQDDSPFNSLFTI